MKVFIHAPGLILIALCGMVCSLCGWDRAEQWLENEYEALARRCHE